MKLRGRLLLAAAAIVTLSLLISGALSVNGYTLETGDGAAISEESHLKLAAHTNNTEFLLFDLN